MVADALMSELKYQMRSAQQRHLRVRMNTNICPPPPYTCPPQLGLTVNVGDWGYVLVIGTAPA